MSLAQNAKVNEYDCDISTGAYTSLAAANASGGTAWTETDRSNGYVDVTIPFSFHLGESQVAANSTLRVSNDGSATITSLTDSKISPLRHASGYVTTATSVYYKTSTAGVIVEWRKVKAGSNVYSFQMRLQANGDIQFHYGPMTYASSEQVYVGLAASASDVLCLAGSDWSVFTRHTGSSTARTLSAVYHPDYDLNAHTGTIIHFTQPACVKPTSLTATATSWNTIGLEWTVSSDGDGYQVKYSTDVDFDPSAEGTSKIVNGSDLTTTIAGLIGSTDYYFYVRKMCGTTPSGWSPRATTTTLPGCYSANLPSVTPDGVVTWTSPDGLVTSYDVKYGPSGFSPETEGILMSSITGLTATIPNLGSNVRYDVYLRTHCNASNITTDWVGPVSFVSPCAGGCTYTLILTDSYGDTWNGNTLSYYANGALVGTYANNDENAHAENHYPDDDTVYVGVCSGDTVSFVYNASGGYASENSMTVLNHVGEVLADYNGGSGTATLYMGIGCYVATCPKPSDLAITNVDGNDVTLSWTEIGTATAWQIAYGLTDNVADYTIVDATANPFTISDLGVGEWHFYVRSNCAAADQSEWTGSVSQNFGYCTPAPTSVDGLGITAVTFGTTLVVNDNAATGINRYQNHSDMVGDAFAGTDVEVNITYSTGYTYGTKIWVDWNNDLTFSNDEQVYYGVSANTRPATLTATFSIPAGTVLGDYRMRIGGTDNDDGPTPCYTGSYGVLRDYTLRVSAAPSCFKPNSLVASNVTSTSATLAWNETGLSTQWEVKYGPRGFNPDETGIAVMVSATPSVTLNYLYMVTDYDAYVRAVCNPEDLTEWSNVCEFATSCPNGGNLNVGTAGTTNNYLPTCSYYNYSWTEQIYTAAEIGGARTIDNIAFEVTTARSANRTVTIYLGETEKSEFSNNTDWIPASNMTAVYTGTLVTTSTGWNKIVFDTPFNYTGTGNLVVAVDDNTGTYVSSISFRATNSGGNKAIRVYSDGTNYNPNTTTYNGTLMRVRNDIVIETSCDTGSCNAPATVVTLSDAEYAATLTFTDVNEATSPVYGLIWGPQGFDPEIAGITVSPVTTSTYTISNLAMLTTYDVYVYAICDGTAGRKVRYTFTTPFIPNCKTPNHIAASGITYNNAAITWHQPGDAPQFWTIRYADTILDPATAAATDYTEQTVQASAGATAQLTGLVAGTDYYVYVKATCSTNPPDESPWSDVLTFSTPICMEPSDVAADSVFNNEAQIAWTENGSATAWTLIYGPQGFDPISEGVSVICSDTVKTLMGLEPNTYYDVYVKSNCTANDESGLSAVCTFRTVCPDGGEADVTGISAGTHYTLPVNTYYGYSYTQQIISADELSGSGLFSGISFNYSYASPNVSESDVNIYIGTTDKNSFASSADFVDPISLTLVYSGPLICSQGWNEFTFTAPFNYDGTGNIVVALDENASGYSGNSYKFNTQTTSAAMALSYYSDTYNPDPTSSATLSAYMGSKTTYMYRNEMKLVAPCNTDATCFVPASVNATANADNTVAVSWIARRDLRPVVSNFELSYGLAGFNPETSGTVVSNLNNVFSYTITAALEYGASYDVYVRTVCGEGDYSNWAKTSFTTNPSCWTPSDLTVQSTTVSSATLSWTENTPTPATRWEVAYGLEGFNLDNVTPIETTNNAAFELTGLRHSTKYEFYVRTKCSETDHSDWSNVATGTTQCGVCQYADMPLVENFDGVVGKTSSTIENHVLPYCWDYLNLTTTTSTSSSSGYPGYPIAYNSATYSRSGNNHLRFYVETSSYFGDQYAIMPEVGFSPDTMMVSFYAREYNTTSTYKGRIIVGVMSDPNDASTFVAVDSVMPTSTRYEYYEVNMENYVGTGRYVALKAPKPTAGYNYVLVDDFTAKLREKVNTFANNGGSLNICNEFVMNDTTGGTYANNVNAEWVVRPVEAGQVTRLTGTYDLEYGYDYLYLYEGTGSRRTLVATYTGTGNIDYATTSNDWVNNGAVTVKLVTDMDNASNMQGFKLLATCECPSPAADTVFLNNVEANGTYTWAVNGKTYVNHASTNGARDAVINELYTQTNAAGCDSVYYVLNLTLHPDYTLATDAEICERDTFEFYGQRFTATGTYKVSLHSQYGADSIGVLNLQMHAAPTAAIYYNNRAVNTIANACDNQGITLTARSNSSGATFVWDDSSTVAARMVYPHQNNTYTVIATESTYGCTSLPASAAVTTIPIADLTISGNNTICYGQSTTLTVADANGTGATYRWSNNATTESITVSPNETMTYTVSATTASGCVTVAEYTVTVNPLPVVAVSASVNEICLNDEVTLSATAIDGYSYSWNVGGNSNAATITTVPTTTGTYTVNVTDGNGCQNEFTTNTVTVHPSYELNDTLSACVGMLPYTWGAQSLTTAGSVDQTFNIAHGCDSTVHLYFIVKDTAVTNSYRELCQGAPFTFGSGAYTQSHVATTSQVYTYVDTTSGQCPARYNLMLTVNMPATTNFDRVVCDSTKWNGVPYTTTGAYSQTFATTKGCDSVVTMNLIVNNHTFAERNEVTCDSLTWNGVTYYTEGDYTQAFANADVNGCDSTETLHLTQVKHASYHVDDILWCDTRTYTWIDGETYAMSEVGNNIFYTLPNTQNAAGCDSTEILHLVLNLATDTLNWKNITACDEYTIDTVSCSGVISPKYINESGDYQLRTYNATAHRDEVARLHLTVKPSGYHTNVVTACVPYTWSVQIGVDTLGNPIMYEVGTYNPMGNDTTISFEKPAEHSANGCSHIEILRLTALHPTPGMETGMVCNNGVYTTSNGYAYYGSNYEAGIHTLSIPTTTLDANGCRFDSTLVLTVNPVYNEHADLVLCESQFVYSNAEDKSIAYAHNTLSANDSTEIAFNGKLLNETPVNIIVPAYWHTLPGCDSVVNLNVTVYPTTYDTLPVSTCYAYRWDAKGKAYDVAGHIFDSIFIVGGNGYGCDRMAYLDLTLNDSIVNDTVFVDVCSEYQAPDGRKYRETKTFRRVEVSKNGCDSITYTTYRVLNIDEMMIDQHVVSTDPYVWSNGRTYTQSVDGVYNELHSQTGCDSILVLHFTKVDTITLCETELPYTTAYGFVLGSDAVSGTYTNSNVRGNDTIVTYVIHRETHNAVSQTVCDHFMWHETDYTEDGIYTYAYSNEVGCTSVDTLHLTLLHNTNAGYTTTACDSYNWNGSTYTEGGIYTYSYTATNNCPSVDTLTLTINVNNGSNTAVAACDTYTWERDSSIHTTSGVYTFSYNDVNGCAGVDTLTLTVNNTVTGRDTIISNEGSYRYDGVLYTAPYEHTFVDTLASVVTGCDSIRYRYLKVRAGESISDSVLACGTYEWRNGHTYAWIPMSERQNHGMAQYKDVTANSYVYAAPTDTTYLEDGSISQIHVLWLTLVEAYYGNATIARFPLSQQTLTLGDPAIGTVVIDFSAELAARKDTTVTRVVTLPAYSYCDSIITYTINLVYDYDTISNIICAAQTLYTWNGVSYPTTVPGTAYLFTQTFNEGTADEQVTTMHVLQKVANTSEFNQTACDSMIWEGNTYSANTDAIHVYTDHFGCDSTVTMHLTINASRHDVFADVACDHYAWVNNGSTTSYTASGTYTHTYAAVNGCESVDTLKLTVNHSDSRDTTVVACDSYEWDDIEYTVTGTYTTAEHLSVEGCPSADTLHLIITASTHNDTAVVACDSFEWNGSTYTTTGTYTYDYYNANGCASTDTLHLTLHNNSGQSETVVACDSTKWHGTWYKMNGSYTYNYSDANGCASVDTLMLTINANTGNNLTVTACDAYTWAENGTTYNATSLYTNLNTDSNGCRHIDTLNLTVNYRSIFDSTLWVSEGSYRYGSEMIVAPAVRVFNEVLGVANAANCDSIVRLTLHVGNYYYDVNDVISCNEYTWRDGNTYTWMSPEARAAAGNALYWNQNADSAVVYAPTFTVNQEDDFDSIIMLNLTLTQNFQGTDVLNFPISLQKLHYGDSVFDYSPYNTARQTASVTEVVHFPSSYYCDSTISLIVNLVNNYNEVASDDICVTQSSYTWRGHTIGTVPVDNNYDIAHTYYVYDTVTNVDSLQTRVEYMTVHQHPLRYSTERRTVCDSYTWNGTTFTESTSNATRVMTDRYGCDSTVTLKLTIRHNSSTYNDVVACNKYTWTATDGQMVNTFAATGIYTYDYTSAEGCPSTDTLDLVVNYKTNDVYTDTACDSYDWNGITYNVSGTYTYDYVNANGCASQDTLLLTVRHSANTSYVKTACDGFTWHDSTYTVSGEYYFNFNNDEGCPSTDTLRLTVNMNSSHPETIAACDNYGWHGTTYANSGNYTFNYADANGCASTDTLHLTMHYNTNASETAVACQTYDWLNNGTTTTYTASGIYTNDYVSADGCASTDTLYLTIGIGRSFKRDTVENCGPYTWIVNGETIDVIDHSMNTATTVVNPATGCDSVILLYLTVYEAPVVETDVTVCETEMPYIWRNQTLTEAGNDTVTAPFSATCDSTFILNLTIKPTLIKAITDQICYGSDYIANGFNIPSTNLTVGEHTFVDTVASMVTGCDSIVILTLTVGDILGATTHVTACDSYDWTVDGTTTIYALSGIYTSQAYSNANGCTNVDTLVLAINRNAGFDTTLAVCGEYVWNGTTYTGSGDYYYSYIDGNGCASIDTLHLTVSNGTLAAETATACDGYIWHGHTYTTSGTYLYNYDNAEGCTSFDTLYLTINHNGSAAYTVAACEEYDWNGIVYTASGIYTYDYATVDGCASTDTLVLTVNNNSNAGYVQTACESFTWHDTVYTATGDYTYSYTANNGCASIDTLHLTVNYNSSSATTTMACDTYVWNGQAYATTGTFTHNYNTNEGCPSVDTLYLTINNSTHNVITDRACDSYTWHNVDYTTSGTYTYGYTNASGCASTDTLVLTVNSNTNSSVTVSACDSYIWHGIVHMASGDYTYSYYTANGCASVDTLHLTVNQHYDTNIYASIIAGQAYTLFGFNETTAGDYEHQGTTVNGCDSTVTLHLTMFGNYNIVIYDTICAGETYTQYGFDANATDTYVQHLQSVNGADSVVTLHLMVRPVYNIAFTDSICQGSIYDANGFTVAAAGTYTHNYITIHGCDSTVTLALTVTSSVTTNLAATICEGESYTQNGFNQNAAGIYTQNITSANGCDSIVTLTLSLTPVYNVALNDTICQGNAYTSFGFNVDTAGTYIHELAAVNGCDSTVALNLAVRPTSTHILYDTTCAGNVYAENGFNVAGAGLYTLTLDNHYGCDSIVTLHLAVNPVQNTTIYDTICEGDTYTSNGFNVHGSGTYTRTLASTTGCDSIVTLYLFVRPAYNIVFTDTACGGQNFTGYGFNVSATGIYTRDLVTVYGCDSTITLNLTVHESYAVAVYDTICNGTTYTDYGVDATRAGAYPVHFTTTYGCDSLLTVYLTVNPTYDDTINGEIHEGETYTQYGFNADHEGTFVQTLQTIRGCDSTITLILTMNVGINNASNLEDIAIYPNPTAGNVTVDAEDIVSVEVIDVNGRRMAAFTSNQFDISNLAAGNYVLRIVTKRGTAIRRVVKK